VLLSASESIKVFMLTWVQWSESIFMSLCSFGNVHHADGSEAPGAEAEAKAKVLFKYGARATAADAAQAATSAALRARSPAHLHASLQFLTSRGWRVERAPVQVLRNSLKWLVARVLFAELHGYAALQHASKPDLQGEVVRLV
jgi:hypothetical protein